VPLHVRVRGLLRATCNSSTSIAGRANERNAISKFLGAFLSSSEEDASASTLYISGLPGTGKTALVNDIIGSINMDEVVLININCMALNNVEALWERLQDDLGALKKSRGRGKPKKAEAKASIGNLLKSSPSNMLVLSFIMYRV
jgi:cell division control protein 6